MRWRRLVLFNFPIKYNLIFPNLFSMKTFNSPDQQKNEHLHDIYGNPSSNPPIFKSSAIKPKNIIPRKASKYKKINFSLSKINLFYTKDDIKK